MPTIRMTFAVLALAMAPCRMVAQEAGRLTGRILDAGKGTPVAGAIIEVIGSELRTTSALDGRYTLAQVPPGRVILRARLIGFRAKVVSGITVQPGTVTRQDITLTGEVMQLQEIEITALAERGTVDRALDEQRNSNSIVNTVSAEQIARSPDSDAAQAIQRVSGVTVQDGRYVFVRGLGERYTTTALNGARIPSAEPEKKEVPLDMFPSALLDGISTTKTFTPDQPGDFSGGSVNLRTREFPAGRKITMSLTAGSNAAAMGREVVRAPTTGGMEWLGFAGNARQIPSQALAAGNLANVTEPQLNSIISSFRNAWTPATGNGTPNSSFNLSVGGEDPVGGQMIGYVASMTAAWSQEVRADEHRALALPTGDGGVQPFNANTGSTGRNTVLWGGLLNLTARVGSTTKLVSSNSYTRGAENEAVSLYGANEEFNQNFLVNRLTFIERSVRSNQLAGEHLLANRHFLDWSVTNSGVTRDEPDRSDLVYVGALDSDGRPVAREWFGGTRSATRTFSDLKETSWNFAANVRYGIGDGGRNAIKVGGAFRMTNRTADSRAFDIFNRALTLDERSVEAEQIFDGGYAEAGLLTMFTNPNGGIYTATDRIGAGYAMAELWFGGVQVLAGGRVEAARLTVSSLSPQGVPVDTRLDNVDVLPALTVNVPLGESHNLRFAASQTLARPEYRELSPVSYFEPLGGTITRGNPDLRRTLIQNLDARWEWFPRSGEVVSFGVFAKRFQDPIEKIYVGTTGAANLSFINAEEARNLGVELEARKNLSGMGALLAPVTLFANATVMKSSIVPGNSEISALTSDRRPMVGQSAYVFNGGVNYDLASGFAATVLYNVAGPRIVEAGTQPLPDAYEQARHLLDASIQVPAWNRLVFRLDGKNLLDARIEVQQGSVTRLSYRQGRQFMVGVKYTT